MNDDHGHDHGHKEDDHMTIMLRVIKKMIMMITIMIKKKKNMTMMITIMIKRVIKKNEDDHDDHGHEGHAHGEL